MLPKQIFTKKQQNVVTKIWKNSTKSFNVTCFKELIEKNASKDICWICNNVSQNEQKNKQNDRQTNIVSTGDDYEKWWTTKITYNCSWTSEYFIVFVSPMGIDSKICFKHLAPLPTIFTGEWNGDFTDFLEHRFFHRNQKQFWRGKNGTLFLVWKVSPPMLKT